MKFVNCKNQMPEKDWIGCIKYDGGGVDAYETNDWHGIIQHQASLLTSPIQYDIFWLDESPAPETAGKGEEAKQPETIDELINLGNEAIAKIALALFTYPDTPIKNWVHFHFQNQQNQDWFFARIERAGNGPIAPPKPALKSTPLPSERWATDEDMEKAFNGGGEQVENSEFGRYVEDFPEWLSDYKQKNEGK